jgi:hypothetical protein
MTKFTFMKISRGMLLRMRNVSNKLVNKNTLFMFSNVFKKVIPFVR